MWPSRHGSWLPQSKWSKRPRWNVRYISLCRLESRHRFFLDVLLAHRPLPIQCGKVYTRGIPGREDYWGSSGSWLPLSLCFFITIGLSHRVVENIKPDNSYEVLNNLPGIVNAQQILAIPIIMNFFLPFSSFFLFFLFLLLSGRPPSRHLSTFFF